MTPVRTRLRMPIATTFRADANDNRSSRPLCRQCNGGTNFGAHAGLRMLNGRLAHLSLCEMMQHRMQATR
jgi:hypothetical protein